MTYITFGVVYVGETPDVACRIIETDSEESAIAIAEELGNMPETTIAYTDESLVALACERPDYVDVDAKEN